MSRLLRHLAIGLVAMLSPGVANAATIRSIHIGNWLAGAYTDDATGAFSHCAASATYRNGLMLVIAIDKKTNWSIGLASQTWALTTATRYPVQLSVDEGRTLDATAVAVNANLVKIDLADSSQLFDAFKWGHLLSVAAAGQTFKFQLTATRVILPSLLACVQRHADPTPDTATDPFKAAPPVPEPTTDPFKGGPPKTTPAPFVDANAAPSRRAEASSLLANILIASHVQSFRILEPDEAAKLNSDAAWRSGDTYGLVNIVGDGSSRAEDLNAAILASDSKACHDRFFSGSMPDPSGTRLFTSCKSDNQTLTIFYSAIRRPKGGFYVVATGGIEHTGSGDGTPTRQIDDGIRSAAYRVATQ